MNKDSFLTFVYAHRSLGPSHWPGEWLVVSYMKIAYVHTKYGTSKAEMKENRQRAKNWGTKRILNILLQNTPWFYSLNLVTTSTKPKTKTKIEQKSKEKKKKEFELIVILTLSVER